jgi:nitroimidazol reductase NimA-like FMN-containing flavoprotein (pyridoxamine 5'-phosphate oxidase superfamily)
VLLAENSLMRRKDQEIVDWGVIDSIIGKAQVCRLALSDGDQPYVVPMCFGYDGKNLYFHSAGEGKKIEILKKNPKICFEIEGDCEIEKGKAACDWGMIYKSVIGFGTISFIDDIDSKRKALDVIAKKYAHESFTYPEKAVEKVTVIKVDIEEISGKHSS